ncbi:MAG: hypothetical protein U1F43_38005 [Myxococcota bacterium]
MRTRLILSISGAAALATAGCSQAGAPGDTGHPLAVTVAPLDLPQMTDACYGLTVYNTTDRAQFGPDTQVWTQPSLCASQYGAEGGIRFTGICDAAAGDNSVRLVLNDVYRNGTVDSGTALTAGADYINPCPAPTNPGDDNGCILEAPCEANQDSKVVFNLEVMRQAELGFFDTVVKFQDVFCAAKLDCLDDDDQPLTYLYDASTHADGPTAVLGFTCLGGSGDDVHMYLDDLVVTCGGDSATVDPSAGPGLVTPSQSGSSPVLFAASVNTGLGFQGASYWNVMLGLNPHAGEACVLTTRGTVSETALTGTPFATAPGTRYPYIDWSVTLSDGSGSAMTCGRQPLNGGSGVATRYTPIDAPETFAHELVTGATCPCWDSADAQQRLDDIRAGSDPVAYYANAYSDGNISYTQLQVSADGEYSASVSLAAGVYGGSFCEYSAKSISEEASSQTFFQPVSSAALAACLADIDRLIAPLGLECVSDADCAANPNGSVCDTTTNTCVACASDADCAGNADGSLCGSTLDGSPACVECRSVGDCDDQNPCTADQCSAGSCAHDAAPLDGATCTADASLCTHDVCASGVCQAGVAPTCEFGPCVADTGLCPPAPYACPCFDASQVATYFASSPPVAGDVQCFPDRRPDQYPAALAIGTPFWTTGPGTGMGGNGTTQCNGPNGYGSNYAGGLPLSTNQQANCADVLRAALGQYGLCGCTSAADCDDHDACSTDQCDAGVCSNSFDASCTTP